MPVLLIDTPDASVWNSETQTFEPYPLRDIASEIAETLANQSRRPYYVLGIEYQGDIWLNDICKAVREATGDVDRTIYDTVCQILKDEGFAFHN